MRIVVQEEFGEPEWASEAVDEPLVIHQRVELTKNKRLAIFVHGLGGSRYGSDSTWGNFPKFLYEDFPNADIGLYSYRTALRRLGLRKSVEIEAEAKILATCIRELPEYKSIVLIGHSLGGILAKGAVANLASTNQKKILLRLKGLFLMAAPQLGSLKVWWPIQWLSSDLRILKPHSRYLANIDQTFRDHLWLEEARGPVGRNRLPTWAIVAAGDRWVDPLSATIGLTAKQISTVSGSHTEIVKPATKYADSYHCVRRCIEKYAYSVSAANREIEKWELHERSAALPQDMTAVREFAVRFLGPNISPIDLMTEWSQVDPETISVIKRIDPDGTNQKELVAYFCVLRLNDQAAARMKRGELTGLQIRASDLAKPDEASTCVYVAGVIGANIAAKAVALEHLKIHITSISSNPETQVFTRPVTDDGLRLVHQFKMKQVAPNSKEIGTIFVGSPADFVTSRSR